MLVAIDALTKKVAAEPLKDRLASTTGMKKVFQARRCSKFKRGVQGADGFLAHQEAGAGGSSTSSG